VHARALGNAGNGVEKKMHRENEEELIEFHPHDAMACTPRSFHFAPGYPIEHG
jgi:hypothetical protein